MTTSAGFLAAGGPVAWGPFAAVSLGTMLAAGSANTFNQVRWGGAAVHGSLIRGPFGHAEKLPLTTPTTHTCRCWSGRTTGA